MALVVVGRRRLRRWRRGAATTPDRRARRAPLRRRDGDGRHRPHLRRRTPPSRSAAASPSSTATATAGPTSTSPAGATPAALYRNDSPVGGALRVHAARTIRRPTSPTSTAPTRSTSTATARSTWRSCGSARTSLLRGLGDCRFERANEALGVRRRRRPGRRPSARRGRARPALPTLAFGNYLDPRRVRRADLRLRRQRAAPAGPRRGTGYGAADRRSRPATARCRCCSATGTAPAGATCGSRNDRHYYDATARTSCGAIAPGEAPRLYTAADGWVAMQIWGMGIASYDLTGDGYPEVLPDEPGRQQAPDADRRAGPADLPRHRAQARRERRPSRSPAATPLPSTAWHPGVPGRQQRRLHRPVRLQGQRQRAARLRREGPEQPAPRASPTGPSCEGAEAAGIVSFDRGPRRGAGRLQPRRPARPRRGQLRRPGPGSGATSARATPPQPAPMGHWLGAPALPAGPEPRRDRRLDRGPGRRR